MHSHTNARSKQGQSKDEFNFTLTSNSSAERVHVHNSFPVVLIMLLKTRCHSRFNCWIGLFSLQVYPNRLINWIKGYFNMPCPKWIKMSYLVKCENGSCNRLLDTEIKNFISIKCSRSLKIRSGGNPIK